MSAFPQRIWTPSTKDVAGSLAPQRVIRRATGSAAAVGVSFAFPYVIPADQILLLRHVLIVTDPGAAQVATQQNVFVTDVNAPGFGQIVMELISGTPVAPIAVAAPSAQSWQGEIGLLSTDALFVSGTFDLGAAVNNLTCSIGGYLVPRGNWQLG